VRNLLKTCDRPLLIDADGLNALQGAASLLRTTKCEVVISPHAGELSRLTGEGGESIERRRVEAAREAALAFRCAVVLKGNPTATSSRRGTVYLNTTGNPGLATIGAGDVLSGLIGGLRAQGMTMEAAARAGVFLHGRAADLAASRLGQRSLLAGDVLEHISGAFASIGDRAGSAE
jgi:NAD(P)H-hydrate epimerase